jgi:hypothetical protein
MTASRCVPRRKDAEFIQRDAKAFMAATSRGLIALAVSGPLATVGSIWRCVQKNEF